MVVRRRQFLAAGAATVTAVGAARWTFAQVGVDMYGLIGKMTAVAGKREELIAVLLWARLDEGPLSAGFGLECL